MKPIIHDEFIIDGQIVDIDRLRAEVYSYFQTLAMMLEHTEFDHISKYSSAWIRDHLENEEAFEQSVLKKAHEINSGDPLNDYYQALLIRRDQLLAARDVYREYTNLLRDIFDTSYDVVRQRLELFNFEVGIYLRALEYYNARQNKNLGVEHVNETKKKVAPVRHRTKKIAST